MRILCVAVSLCLLCLLCVPLGAQDKTDNGTGVPNAPARALSDAVHYQIYSEALSNFFSDSAAEKSSDPIFVSDHTPIQSGRGVSAASKSVRDRALIGRFSEALEQETIDDYEKNRATAVHFADKFSPALHVVLLTDAALAQVLRQGSGVLPEPYRRGIVTLSRIGFNSRRTQAVVSMDYFCGPFCSAGEMFLLVRAGSAWKVISKIPISEG